MTVVQVVLPSRQIRASGSNTTKSASKPAAIRPLRVSQPARRAGPAAIQRARSSRVNPRLLASVHISGSATERLAIPPQAVRKLPSLKPLHCRRTRRVISDHDIDGAISEALPQSLAIFAAANRRRTLVQRRSIGNRFGGQMQIVWTRLDAHWKSFGARRAQLRERRAGREMHDVQAKTVFAAQR